MAGVGAVAKEWRSGREVLGACRRCEGSRTGLRGALLGTTQACIAMLLE